MQEIWYFSHFRSHCVVEIFLFLFFYFVCQAKIFAQDWSRRRYSCDESTMRRTHKYPMVRCSTKSQGYWVLYHHHHLKMTLEKSQRFIYWEGRKGGRKIESKKVWNEEDYRNVNPKDFRSVESARSWHFHHSLVVKLVSFIQHLYACRICNGMINRST